MNKEQILGVIRHLLTFVGGVFVLKGYIEESIVPEIVGGVVTIIGTVWSIFSKTPKAEQ
jgi:hypothetical protein